MISSTSSNDRGVIARLANIVGPSHVLTGREALAGWLTDARGLYSGAALCVVEPACTDEVSAVMKLCSAERIPVTPIGGNTGLVGGAVPLSPAGIGLSLRRMNRIRALSPQDNTMTVEAGAILQTLQEAVAAQGRLLPLSLSSEGSCQIGGNIATNAGGIAALRYGVARQQVLGLEVVLPDGRVLNGLKRLRKDNAGYDLNQLFIGSEGTLGVITAAVLRLEPAPVAREVALLALDDVATAPVVLNRLRKRFDTGISAAEVIEGAYLELVIEQFPQARAPFAPIPPWSLLIELSTADPGADLGAALEGALAELFEDDLIQDALIAQNAAQATAFWELRHNISAAARMTGPNISNDSSVPLDRQADYVARTREAILARYPSARPLYVGHIGDGNLHLVIVFPSGHFVERASFEAAEQELGDIIDRVVMDLDGSITAEHGVGTSYQARFRRTADATRLALVADIKALFDPLGIMNPGKVISLPDVVV